MMTRKRVNMILSIVLSWALLLNSTVAYAKIMFVDPAVAQEPPVEDLEARPAQEETTQAGADASGDGEELPASEDAVLNPAAYVTGVNSLFITGGVDGKDYSYDKETDIITIQTNTAMTIKDAYEIYSSDHRTSLCIDSPEGANLTLNTVHIYAYDVTKENIADKTAANLPTGRAGIEITDRTGDVTITVQNRGDREE